ncbi:hypothetical protein HDU97_004903 [Phlyctochytrium planicorne]|nr:hypothetical protein HDU97_004903 [Phlyctochytrium planicorne]
MGQHSSKFKKTSIRRSPSSSQQDHDASPAQTPDPTPTDPSTTPALASDIPDNLTALLSDVTSLKETIQTIKIQLVSRDSKISKLEQSLSEAHDLEKTASSQLTAIQKNMQEEDKKTDAELLDLCTRLREGEAVSEKLKVELNERNEEIDAIHMGLEELMVGDGWEELEGSIAESEKEVKKVLRSIDAARAQKKALELEREEVTKLLKIQSSKRAALLENLASLEEGNEKLLALKRAQQVRIKTLESKMWAPSQDRKTDTLARNGMPDSACNLEQADNHH